MKIATVTVHSAISYGAMLQAYALQQALLSLGVETEILDYRNKMIESKNRVIPIRQEASVKRRIKDIVSAPLRYDRNRRFYAFMHGNMKLSQKTYRSVDDLDGADDSYDAFIVGSDQVWNPKHADFDPVYFLEFVKDNTKKNSYAASFGFTEIPEILRSEYERRLDGFNRISVREESGVAIVKDLLHRSATRSIDPTLLLEKTHWEKLAQSGPEEGYILVYEVNQASSQTYKLAQEIATKHGLRVVSITQAIRTFEDLRAHQADPAGLLGYIQKADYVLTDSFHGTVFSILFEKKFVFCQNYSNDVNIRMMELLEMTGLQARSESVSYDEDIDWTLVGNKLDTARLRAFTYLKSIIKEAGNA